MTAVATAPLVTRWRAALAPTLAGVAVAQQVAYPLSSDGVRDTLTAGIVLALSAAVLVDAAVSRRCAIRLLIRTAVPGLAVEVLGVHSGVPFGGYTYADRLGPALFGVPLLIGLAWTMLAWPAVVAAVSLVRSTVARVLLAAWTLAGLDLFLDPQMVRAGYWRWHDPSTHLPGVPQVPLSNVAGWLGVSLVIAVMLVPLAARPGSDPGGNQGGDRGSDRLPRGLLIWLYAGWIVALAVFGGQPWAAAWGALALAPTVAPTARALLFGR